MLGEICSNDSTNVKIPHLHIHKLKTAMKTAVVETTYLMWRLGENIELMVN